MEAAPEVTKITHVPELDSRVRNQLEDVLKETGVPAAPNEGLGPAIEKPVLSPQLAKAVGAENVGNEEFNFNEEIQSKHRDVKSGLKGIVRSILGGSSKIRQAPGRLFSKLRRGKIAGSAKIQNKHDPGQLEIE